MKKALRIIALIFGALVVIVLCIVGYVKFFLPNVGPPPDLKVVATPEKIERGKYLANHVMICMDCHSTREWNYFAGPLDPKTLGKGGEEFNRQMGFPGVVYSANITPAGIGNWTDGEVFRAITTGVRKNGQPIFPVMPYHGYGKVDQEDIEAVIAYLRTLAPIEFQPPASTYDFPMNIIINTIPEKAQFSKRPPASDTKAYGKYLVTAAACRDCHTPFDQGKFDTSKYFAGGRTFQLPSGVLTTANLTPDKETGTGSWTKEIFLAKFSAYRDSAFAHRPANIMTEFNSIMPWSVYAGMTDEDLGAIFEYIHSLEPIKQKVTIFQPRSGMK